jgi:hypothetical protein
VRQRGGIEGGAAEAKARACSRVASLPARQAAAPRCPSPSLHTPTHVRHSKPNHAERRFRRFDTAVEEAQRALMAAKVEAGSACE